MHNRFDLKCRLAVLPCIASLFLAVIGGLLILADETEDTQSSSIVSLAESSADWLESAIPPNTTVPATGEPSTPPNTTVPATGEPLTPPNTTVPATGEPSTPPSTTIPTTGGPSVSTGTLPTTGTPAVSTGGTNTPVTTTVPVTTTTERPNYTTDPVTKTGALQSVPPFPLSTDPVTGTPEQTNSTGGANQPTAPAGSSSIVTPTTADVSAQNPQEEPSSSDNDAEKKPAIMEMDEEVRKAGLTRLATVFSVAFIVALAAIMLAKFVKLS